MTFCYHCSNFRQKYQADVQYAFRESDKNTPLPSPPLSKDEAPKNIGQSMGIRILIFCFNSVTVSYLISHDCLLQNATGVITKCDNCFITKCSRSLLQNASSFLLQNATVMLQNAMIIIQNATVITKCDVYNTLRQ